jgi:hypothetical protein
VSVCVYSCLDEVNESLAGTDTLQRVKYVEKMLQQQQQRQNTELTLVVGCSWRVAQFLSK